MPLGVCHTCRRGFILENQGEIPAPDCPDCGSLLAMQRVGKPEDLPRVPLALRRSTPATVVHDERRSGSAVR